MELDDRVMAFSVVGCYYPNPSKKTEPGSKFRPSLVLEVKKQNSPPLLYMVFATGQGSENFVNHDSFSLRVSANPDGFKKGPVLDGETRFNFKDKVRLPLEEKWFSNNARFTRYPKMTFYGNLKNSDVELAQEILKRVNYVPSSPTPVLVTYKRTRKEVAGILLKCWEE